jgi:hypothetical protein
LQRLTPADRQAAARCVRFFFGTNEKKKGKGARSGKQ